ncbi:MAG: hypothetical protein OJI67_15380, partial [Prosthecobacter sp.]|nr:hypothetical protein [Prosthecobacter sp.]
MYCLNSRPARQHTLRIALFSLALVGNSLVNTVAGAADVATFNLAEKEIQRRAETVGTQQARLPEAEALFKKGDTAAALVIFEDVYSSLPDVPLAQEARTVALDGYLRAGLVRAKELVEAGDYPAANAVLDKLDGPNVAKGDGRIARLRSRLNDPDRFPPALTPEHLAHVEEVNKLLILANSQRETGQYDKALLTFESVLRLDPYNSAARNGMEVTEQDRSRYFEDARNHTRSKMLNEVNRQWEAQVPPQSANISDLFGANAAKTPAISRNGRDVIQDKLRKLIIDKIDFSGAALQEVVEFLRIRSRDLDPTGKGIDFVIGVPPELLSRQISLNLQNVPIEEVLRYATEIAGLNYRVENYAVRLTSNSESSGIIISKTYRVPPDFITSAPVGAADTGAASTDPFANPGAAANSSGIQVKRLGAQELLESYGVTFGEGASASYSPTTNLLIVHNTAKNIELVDMFVEQAQNRSPKQVVIDVRLLEIGENRLNELGFDWLLGGFGSRTELSGGTIGNSQVGSNYLTGDFPTQVATAAGSTALGVNPITAGLRSAGNLGIQGVDSVLFGSQASTSTRAPGVLSLSGVLTNPQFQVVLRALNQKKGIDLVSQPSVITRSGQQASLEITREMLYPTEFDPPQIPTNFGTTIIDAVTGAIVSELPPAVVTPSTPTAFATRKTGAILNVEPVISEDGRTVDLTITPEFTDFTGFVNYGSPIRTLYQGSFVELTENLIFQPVFDTKKITTAVKIWDGATIVLGGLIKEQETIIEDKVPLIGDAPFVGRLFKSDVKQRNTRSL